MTLRQRNNNSWDGSECPKDGLQNEGVAIDLSTKYRLARQHKLFAQMSDQMLSVARHYRTLSHSSSRYI